MRILLLVILCLSESAMVAAGAGESGPRRPSSEVVSAAADETEANLPEGSFEQMVSGGDG